MPPTIPPTARATPALATTVTTAYRAQIYDAVRTIPAGKVSTYGAVAAAAGGSARSVGQAMRNNPFAPAVP